MILNKYKILPPPCIMCGAQGPIDRRIIIVLVLALIIVTGLYISDYRIKPWNITCSSPDITLNTGAILRNNMQATHTYTEKISTKDTLTCIKADDHGDLWGSSMQPTFFEGNTVLLKNYTTQPIRTGDIIRFFRYTDTYTNCTLMKDLIANNSLGGAYVHTDMAVLHRVNAVYDDTIIVQGDNLNEQEIIDKCQVTDIVIGILYT